MLSVSQSLRVPQPKAWIRSAISRLAMILAVVALATLRILPRIGRIACVLRSRACLAEPPAESPSTMKISVPAGSSAEQSVSLPGRRSLRDEVAVLRLTRSEEHTSELQSLMRISYAVFCLKKKNKRETNAYIESRAI